MRLDQPGPGGPPDLAGRATAGEAPGPGRRLAEMDAAWAEPCPGDRLAAVRRAGMRLRQRVLESGRVVALRSFPIVTFPYPTRYALGGAARSPAPFVLLRNVMHLVQVDQGGRLVTVLVNPTEAERAREAPFFARSAERYGKLLSERVFSRRHATVASALAEVGLRPEQVDYVTFDHLHAQDVRGLLGTTEPEPGRAAPTAPLLPRARLLVQRAELRALRHLHPLQAPWYVRDAVRGVAAERIEVIDGDVLLGGGLALVRSPGHTEGNTTIVLHTDRGLWTVSENGVAVDAWAPLASELPGLRRHAREHESEFVLNSNTREQTLDQYTSMALERTLADPSAERPEFPQCLPSSELVGGRLTPGLAPTFRHGAVAFGQIQNTIQPA